MRIFSFYRNFFMALIAIYGLLNDDDESAMRGNSRVLQNRYEVK